MKVKISELKQIVNKVLASYGFNAEEAEQIGEVLLYAQMRGNNQGIVKLIGKGIPKREGNTELIHDKETEVSALVNGARNHAMVVMNYITDLAIEKAKKSGMLHRQR